MVKLIPHNGEGYLLGQKSLKMSLPGVYRAVIYNNQYVNPSFEGYLLLENDILYKSCYKQSNTSVTLLLIVRHFLMHMSI